MKISNIVRYYGNLVEIVENAINNSEKCFNMSKVVDNYIITDNYILSDEKNSEISYIYEYTVNFETEIAEYCFYMWVKVENCRDNEYDRIICNVVLTEDMETIVESKYFTKTYDVLCNIIK